MLKVPTIVADASGARQRRNAPSPRLFKFMGSREGGPGGGVKSMLVRNCSGWLLASGLPSSLGDPASAVHPFPMEPADAIKHLAREAGFDDCRIAAAAEAQHAGNFREWIADGCHGDMGWM